MLLGNLVALVIQQIAHEFGPDWHGSSEKPLQIISRDLRPPRRGAVRA
jgi:hypothetical protein